MSCKKYLENFEHLSWWVDLPLQVWEKWGQQTDRNIYIQTGEFTFNIQALKYFLEFKGISYKIELGSDQNPAGYQNGIKLDSLLHSKCYIIILYYSYSKIWIEYGYVNLMKNCEKCWIVNHQIKFSQKCLKGCINFSYKK